MTTPDSRDTDRDAWLSEALRHAPDAGSDASPRLSESILREARAAVAPPARPAFRPAGDHSVLHRLAAAWAWLARPPVAAGFASVMVATLVGLLWWGKPLEDTLPPREPASVSPAAVPAAATPPAAAAPTVADAARSDRESTPALAEATKRRVEAPPARKADAAPPAAPAPPPPAVTGKMEAHTPAVAPSRTAEAFSGTRQRNETAANSPTAVAAAEPFPARQAAAPAAMAAAPAPAAPPAVRRDADTATAEAPSRALAAAASDKSTAPADNELRSSAGSASPALAKARGAEVRSSPLAGLLRGIAQEPERWSWQRLGGSGRPQPMNTALQGWLLQLERSTTSRWRPAREPTPAETTRGLRLLHDGVPHMTLSLSNDAVRVLQHGTASASALPPVAAPLPPASVEAITRALDDATP